MRTSVFAVAAAAAVVALCVASGVSGRVSGQWAGASEGVTWMQAVVDTTTPLGFRVEEGRSGVAYGYRIKTMNETGWDSLYMATNPVFEDAVAMRGAGVVEAYLSANIMSINYFNLNSGGYVDPKIKAFMWANYNYTVTQAARGKSSAYYAQVELVLEHFEGLYAGFKAFATEPRSGTLDKMDILSLSAQGDIETLPPVVGLRAADDPANMYGQHCSGLVKLTDDLMELYAGHSTWNTFNSMIRMMKRYEFPLRAEGTVAVTSTFPSYPGALMSIDDMYTLSSGLVSIETTNGITSQELLDKITPTGGIFSWIRTIVANRMASNGQEWTQIFAKENSGTYNNQWFVVDYNLFTPGGDIVDGLLWIVEQIPGDCVAADHTDVLRYGYWPSYNVPTSKYIFNVSGFPEQVAKYGPSLLSYDRAARAKIFRRGQGDIHTFEQFQAMMRYNDWENDPFSLGNAGLQISSRFDLVDKQYPNDPLLQKQCFGATDSKATSAALMKAGAYIAGESGPSHDVQPVFQWKDWPNVLHEAMPEAYGFDWVTFDQW